MQYEEHSLIPFEPWEPASERALIVAPHPDDEVIGCGGLIAALRSRGRQVRVVVVTDGSAGGDESPTLVATRERELRAGLAILDVDDIQMLGIPDRAVAEHESALARAVEETVASWQPDLIVIPSPLEVHPDHAAVARGCIAALQRDSRLPSRLPLSEVAFYEVSQPFRPNRLLDITEQAAVKRKAIEAHESQTARLSYAEFAAGLNRYRSMTLGPASTSAEGYWVAPLREISTTPAGELATMMSPAPALMSPSPTESVSIVIRTRNRHALLREAVASALAGTVRAEIVVVNDGGDSPRELLPAEVRLVDLQPGVGRSEAMNRGVEAATGELVCFLDDDDLFAPEHVEVLVHAFRTGDAVACYTDAVSVALERSEDGGWREVWRQRIYASDFDPALLRVDNFIPLNTLMVRRADFLDAGGFSPDLDLFEDWDFLLRLAQRGTFTRVPRVTCTIRHFPGTSSLIQAASADASRIAEGKQVIWNRHGISPNGGEIAAVLERYKREKMEAETRAALATGNQAHAERVITQLQRDKTTLIESMGREVNEREQLLAEARINIGRLEDEIRRLAKQLTDDAERAAASLAEARSERDEKAATIHQLWGEIGRLNSLLDQIYSSRTWRVHSTIERLKGRR